MCTASCQLVKMKVASCQLVKMKVADGFPKSMPNKLRVSESKLEKHLLPLKVCPLSLVSVGQMKVAGASLDSVSTKLRVSGSNESSRCFP